MCLSFSGLASLSIAGGPIDGIYTCGISLAGKAANVYIAVIGHTDGTTIYVPAAVSPTNDAHGYGIGTATATSFSGTTMFGLPFNFVINPTLGRLTGTAGTIISGANQTLTVNCFKIW